MNVLLTYSFSLSTILLLTISVIPLAGYILNNSISYTSLTSYRYLKIKYSYNNRSQVFNKATSIMYISLSY